MSETLQTRERKAQPPKEGEWFEVKPKTIDRKLFEEEREDPEQERTRQLILEAFAEVDSNPEEYGEDFEVMVPKKTWPYKTVAELKNMACKLGDHIADWVEQVLKWAQRIANGEAWEVICNNADTAKWYRLVVWKDGYVRFIGGSNYHNDTYSMSDVDIYNIEDDECVTNAVPLVARRKKVA